MVVTAPTSPPLPDELTVLLRRMRLPNLRNAAREVLATARAQRWDPAETLRVLLAEEVAGRDDATRRQHRRAASPRGRRSRPGASTTAPSRPRPSTPWPPWSGSDARRTSPSPARPAPARPTWSRRSRTPRSTRPPGRLVHPGIPDRRGRARRRRRLGRPHHHPDHPCGPDRGRSMPTPRLCRGAGRQRLLMWGSASRASA